jgi:hypothetical protein
MASSLQDPTNVTMTLNDKIRRLRQLTGSSFDFFVNIHVSGAFPSLPKRGTNSGQGAGYENNAGVDQEFSEGGQFQFGKGWAVVGEEGIELISPTGFVVPHDRSMEILSTGFSPEYQYRIGGDLAGTGVFQGGGGYTPDFQQTLINKNKGGGTTIPSSVMQSEITQAASQVSAIAPMAEATAAAVTQSASVQQATAMQTQQLVSAVTVTSGEMTNLQRETNRLLENQSRTLARDLVAAMVQANP